MRIQISESGQLVENHFFREVTSTVIAGNIIHRENDFTDFNRELLMPHLLSTEGPKIAVADINGDLLEDFVIGSAKHDSAKVFLQTSGWKFPTAVTSACSWR